MPTSRNCSRQKAVRRAIEAIDGPFTSAQIWQKSREFCRAISRATVYRELRQLRKECFIRDIVLPHGLHVSVRTDAEGCCITECVECGRFRICPEFAAEVARVAMDTPVIPSHIAIYLRGRCRDHGPCQIHAGTRGSL